MAAAATTASNIDEYQLYQVHQHYQQAAAQQMVAWEQQNLMSQSAFRDKNTNNDIVLIKVIKNTIFFS